MSKELMKLAGDVPGILSAAAQHMRKLSTQNVEAVKRASAAEHELRLMKLARRMEVRGLEPNLSYEEKVAGLREIPAKKIASLEEAVELAAGGFSLGRVTNSDDSGQKTASDGGELYHSNTGGGDDLEEFVISQQAYG